MQSTTCDNDFTLLQLIFRYCDFNKSIAVGIVDTVFTTVVVLSSYLFRPSFTMSRISIPATLSFSCLIFSTRSTSSIIFLSRNFSWPIVLQFLPHGYSPSVRWSSGVVHPQPLRRKGCRLRTEDVLGYRRMTYVAVASGLRRPVDEGDTAMLTVDGWMDASTVTSSGCSIPTRLWITGVAVWSGTVSMVTADGLAVMDKGDILRCGAPLKLKRRGRSAVHT